MDHLLHLARAAERHAEFLSVEADNTLRAIDQVRDANGTSHYRYQQLFRGIPCGASTWS